MMGTPGRYILQNAELTVAIIPGEGGRVASLVSQRSGLEFLTQSQTNRELLPPGQYAPFQNGPCAGIEECLPTVGPCGAETDGGAVPDHGDFWRLPWDVEGTPDREHLCIRATGFSRPLRFWKEFSIEGSALHVKYRVENLHSSSTSFLYACHPLFAVSEGDHVVLPEEVRQLKLNYSRGERLGVPGAKILWPHPTSDSEVDLRFAGSRADGTAEMFYTGKLQEGRCGLYRASVGQGITLSFDTEQLPYLGLWLCYGGWPDTGVEPLQYAVALEPTLAPHGTLLAAQQANLAYVLNPGESLSWSITFGVSAPGIKLAEFSL
jgi:galactose mutarotase-like enzyme